MFSKLLLLATLLLTSTAHATYFPTFGINNYDALGTYNLTPPSLSDGQTTTLQLDSSGNLKTVSSGTPALPTGAATSALQTTGNTSLSSIDGKLGTLGQKAMAGSAPVVISSDQSAIPASQSGTWNITNVSGTVSLPTGAATSANQSTANTSLSSIDTKLSSQATAANQATANSSLSTISGQLPATLGAKTTANSMAVNIASDQTVPVSGTVNPSIPTSMSTNTQSVSSDTTVTSPSTTKWMIIQADPANTDNIRFGSVSVTTTVGMVLAPGQDSGLMPWGSSSSFHVIPVSGTQKFNITFLF